MARHRNLSKGDTITTFTFVLFFVLLSLAAMAETVGWKSFALGFCALFSLAGALRFRIQDWVNRHRNL